MANLADIKLLAMDVDGVLTDGSIIVNSDGSETKSFSALDGHGIRMWRRAGLQIALVSGQGWCGKNHYYSECHQQVLHDKTPH